MFIFSPPSYVSLLKRNFTISKIEVVKISFTLRLKTYHVKDIFRLDLTLQNCYLNDYLTTFFLCQEFFLLPAQAPNSLIKVIKHHRLSYVKIKHFTLALFLYKLFL